MGSAEGGAPREEESYSVCFLSSGGPPPTPIEAAKCFVRLGGGAMPVEAQNKAFEKYLGGNVAVCSFVSFSLEAFHRKQQPTRKPQNDPLTTA